MAAECVLRGIGVAAAAMCGVFGARDAAACSCLGGVYMVWPVPDATAVPIDTPVVVGGEVVEGMFGAVSVPAEELTPDAAAQSSGLSNTLTLVAENDERVGLTLQRVVPAAACINSYHFSDPRADLAANTRYELRQGNKVLYAFTTGDKRRDTLIERSAAEQLQFEVLGSAADPEQITTVFVANVATQPLYLNFTGSVAETTVATSKTGSGVIQLNLGALTCPEVRVLGETGETLVTKILCDAHRCLENGGIFSHSSCGGNFAVDIDYERFLDLPLGCLRDDAMPTAFASTAEAARPVSGVTQPEAQKVAVRDNEQGCAVANAVYDRPKFLWASFAAAALLLRRRR